MDWGELHCIAGVGLGVRILGYSEGLGVEFGSLLIRWVELHYRSGFGEGDYQKGVGRGGGWGD